MDIKRYVQGHVKRPQGGAAANQFAVLAFDLGLEPKRGHPPAESATFSDQISRNGPSGPWCTLPHGYSPIAHPVTRADESGNAVVIVRKDKFGRDTVLAPDADSMGPRETVHAERSLAARIGLFSKVYFENRGSLPVSVSMFSYYSPCEKCISFLAPLPGMFKIPLWFFSYSLPYVSLSGHQPRGETDYFQNEKAALVAVDRLRSSGWHIT